MYKNIKLTIEYDGTGFYGWQKQEGLRTVEEEVEKAIHIATGQKVKLYASGRTDAGVHAYGQVANFLINTTIPGERFLYPLNDKLPDDICIRKSEEVPEEFHSRFSAIKKTYRYLILQDDLRSPLMRNFAYQVSYKLDIDRMREAIGYFIGRKDFTSLTPIKSSIDKNIRTVLDADVKTDGNIVFIEISGNGFLHNMVRIIAGTVIEVGYGKKNPEDIEGILKAKDRNKAGHTAPATGLYLMKVEY